MTRLDELREFKDSKAMAQRNGRSWIDVSVPLYRGMVHWPGDPEFQAEPARSLERGDVCNLTQISTSVHIGTHMDAPRHFVPGGKGMEALPLEAVMGPCRVLQVRDQHAIKPSHLQGEKLRPGERILFKTRNSTQGWKTERFFEDFVYISKEAAQYLVDARVQTIGVDYLSIGGFFKDGVETHQILLGAGVWVIEGLNLSKVKPGRHELVCLPIKIRGADGAPARAVLRPLE